MAVTEQHDKITRPKPPVARFAQLSAAGTAVGLPMVSFLFILALWSVVGAGCRSSTS